MAAAPNPPEHLAASELFSATILPLRPVRAAWSHIASRLEDRAAVASHVRNAVIELEGVQDAVIESMVQRHVTAPPPRCAKPWPGVCCTRGSDPPASSLTLNPARTD